MVKSWIKAGLKASCYLILALGFNSLNLSTAHASYQLTPSSQTFTPLGQGSRQNFRVVNTDDEPVALELRVTQRIVSEDGVESRPPADADFLVIPDVILLGPGEAQAVQVTWLGDPEPSAELAYRLIAEQVNLSDLDPDPIASQEATTPQISIKFKINYEATLYIQPPGSTPDLVLESVSHQQRNGQDELVLVFNNQGMAHQHLRNLKLSLTSLKDNTSVHLTPDQLQTLHNQNILAGDRRRFVLPWPEELAVGSITADFSFSPR